MCAVLTPFVRAPRVEDVCLHMIGRVYVCSRVCVCVCVWGGLDVSSKNDGMYLASD